MSHAGDLAFNCMNATEDTNLGSGRRLGLIEGGELLPTLQSWCPTSSWSSTRDELAQRDLAAPNQRLAVREQEVVEIEVEQPAKRLA
jgi:hypothetical protein